MWIENEDRMWTRKMRRPWENGEKAKFKQISIHRKTIFDKTRKSNKLQRSKRFATNYAASVAKDNL